ncbi:DsrH like protein [Shewanella denitrificans OS217]|jgi:tRNA 2-thiouridine synthesizing protein B|uniref:DsrH like protein n=1 Tax=Shewanella denitrificans (strain OS217 / ATCC BAA-1090 / DSM 15013) TaxID=318161 RepID=Q12N86_SHEDO|nr:sulfurtransferase complex subunit TusB [Shewanella denitrificans]ABE55090.1 DsrH like protein [Shewanella denitrificans OS217]
MILHLIQTSASQDNALSTCLCLIQPSDSILLMGDAVNCLLMPTWQAQLKGMALFALEDDVTARGLSSLMPTENLPQLQLLNYDEFVAQTLSHQKVITW